ncbi:MAG: biopolymer transporter Tol [Verrucomicrobiales bacterium]|jgi:TolB protein|nr:biopolymer transporter Tol [Verrucomicrobiales bacterium]
MNQLLIKGLSLFAISVFLSANFATAQIEITQGNQYNINAVISGGADASKATAIIQNDFKMHGAFNVTPADSAQFIAKGTLTANGLTGTLSTASGQVFTKNFSGDWRSATHQFTDAIVEAVTGLPGIATSKVVFVVQKTTKPKEIKDLYLMDIDGGVVRSLTNDNSLNLGPKFNKQGNKIVSTSWKSGYADTWIIDLAANNRSRVAFYPGINSGGSFSPDGSRIALTLSKDGNPELYTIGANGGDPQRLTRTIGSEATPVYSPDGSQIAYVSDDRGAPQIYLMPAGGGAAQRFNTFSSYTTEPDWSSDGKLLAYTVRTAGTFQIAVSDIATGQQSVLTASGNNETPSWCRDSRHLVFSRGGKLYLIDSKTKKSVQIDNGLSNCSEPNASK